jgi:WD40-like Beta Propeller Repeat
MTRPFTRNLPLIVLVAFSACSDSPGSPSLGSGALGKLMLTARASGLDAPASFQVSVDQGAPVDIFPKAIRPIDSLSAGNHLVTVTGIASNCAMSGENPRAVTVLAGRATAVDFSLVCVAATGAIEVAVATSGSGGPVTYALLVDDATGTVVPATGTASLTGFEPGEHTVALNSLSSACTLSGSNPRKVTVTAGSASRDTARTTFLVACTGPSALASVRIVFAKAAGGTSFLYSMNLDGSDLRELVEGSAPSVSPDGSRIAFDRGGEIYLMNVDQTDVHRIAIEGQGATWSSDGARIAYAGTGADRAIYVVAADGGGAPIRLSGPTTEDTDYQPAWSPDGRQIAFTRWEGEEFSTIWIVNADGTGQARIGRLDGNVTWTAWSPVWSPDGKIAIAGPEATGSGGRIGPFRAAIFVINRDGLGLSVLAEIPSGFYIASLDDWAPDGKISLTISSERGGDRDIYLIGVGGGGTLVRLTYDGKSSGATFLRGPMP